MPQNNDSPTERTRREVLELRRKMPEDVAAALSATVARRFVSLCGLKKAAARNRCVALYRALPSELGLAVLEDWLLESGVNLCFPRVKAREARELEFVDVSPERHRWQWTAGPYGIQEPSAHLPGMAKEEFNHRVSLVFVPGVAFGPQGERIGMGAGYYDRFLSAVPLPLRVALAYDIQVRENIAQQPWDQSVDWLVTESREYRGPRVAEWMARL